MTDNTFDFSGGAAALDLANTVGGTRAKPTEHLGSYAALLDWARQGGLLEPADAARLARAARARPADAERALQRVIQLRESIFRVFAAAADDREPDRADVERLTGAYARIVAKARPLAGQGRWEWPPTDDLERPVWPAAVSAVELLLSDRLQVLRACASDTCDWLFIDRSRNRSRRWCDMKDCGNREKSRRHYARARADVVSPPTSRGRSQA